jgi:thioester reductase-like protein
MPALGASTTILVIGATGFIGRQVVRHLLNSGRSVIAMARPQGEFSAQVRVMSAIRSIPGVGRLEVIEVDRRNPLHHPTPERLRHLRGAVDTVIHCAGDTAFFPTDMGRFRAGHIDEPLALLIALLGGRLRRWGHVSTAYVCGKRSGTVFEDEGDVGQEFHNPYERVKLQAESAMRAAGERLDIDLRVFRPSIVVGPASETGGGLGRARAGGDARRDRRLFGVVWPVDRRSTLYPSGSAVITRAQGRSYAGTLSGVSDARPPFR